MQSVQQIPVEQFLVRKGGFEPPRLSAPPPQDGVSANSTTSARRNILTQKAITATQNKSSSSMRDVSHRCAGQHFEQSYFSMQPSENYCQGNETGERGSPGQP